MKIKVLSLNSKTALATGVYYLAIITLLALLGVAVYKLVVEPPFSVIGQHECVIDDWSVAGLAATILGVGGTTLTLLGAFAIAHSWTTLHEKVDKRVDEQIKAAIDPALKEQEEKIRKFEETVSKMQIEMDTLKELASNVEKRVQSARRDLTIAMTQLDPWMIEPWASYDKI